MFHPTNSDPAKVEVVTGWFMRLLRIKQLFYWPNMDLDVTHWWAKCSECSSRKGKNPPSWIPMNTFPVGAPFDRIAMDILDTHKCTANNNRYILVISDYFTNDTDTFQLRRHMASAVVNILVTRWITYHGVPSQILADQGAEFEGKVFQLLAKLLQFKNLSTSPYIPQTDGQVESFNRTLNMFVSDSWDNNWDTYLPYFVMAYRSSVNDTTDCTPNLMVYGIESTLPVYLTCKRHFATWGSMMSPGLRLVCAICVNNCSCDPLKNTAIRQKCG